MRGGHAYYCPVGMKFLAPYLSSLTSPLQCWELLIIGLWGWEPRLSTWLLLVRVRVEPQIFLWCCLEQNSYYLEVSALFGCSLANFWGLFWSVPIGVSGLLVFSATCFEIMRQKESPGCLPLCSQCPNLPSWTEVASFSLCFSLLIFDSLVMSRDFICI